VKKATSFGSLDDSIANEMWWNVE